MTLMPASWSQAKLGDLTVETLLRIPAPDEVFEYIDISAVDRLTKRISAPRKITGADAPSRARKVVEVGDVLVSLTRPNLNAVALVPEELNGQIASTGFDVLRAPIMEPRWIYYIVRSEAFVSRMSNLVRGALYPAVRSSDVRSFLAPVAPLNQQVEISEKLDAIIGAADACRARLDRVAASVAKLRTSILASATNGMLSEDWREQNGIDAAWTHTKLGLVAGDFSYGSAAKSIESGSVPVLRMGNIREGRLVWDDLVFTSDPQEIVKYRLRSGDVLFNRTNTPELVGKTAVYHGEREAIYAGYLIRVRCKPELLPDYLAYCLNSPAGREYCWSVKSDSVGQSNINAKKLAAFPFRLPSVAEQEIIISRVEALNTFADELVNRCANARTIINRLIPETITKGLRGDLIPQSVGDEPAAMLLERISREREERNSAEKRRKPRAARAVRVPRENAAMTKSRQDPDVNGKPYLAELLRSLGGSQGVELLFRQAQLPVPDFYKQLAWEVEHGHIRDDEHRLEAI